MHINPNQTLKEYIVSPLAIPYRQNSIINESLIGTNKVLNIFDCWEGCFDEYYLEKEKNYALNIPVMVRYRLSAKKLYPTAELGFSSYYVRNEFFKASNLTLSGGLSLYYQWMKHCSIFLQSRYEIKPQTFRLGVGLLF